MRLLRYLAMTAAVGCVQIQFIALKPTAKPFSPTNVFTARNPVANVGLNGFAVSEDIEFAGDRRHRHCEVRSNLEYAKTHVVVRLLRTSQ